jgi:outer membrane immunogenic protein
MYRFRLTALAIVAVFGFASFASAADMPVKAPMREPSAAAAANYNWTGFYVGGNVGYGWGTSNEYLSVAQTDIDPGNGTATFATTASNKLKGVIGGAQVGYDWQINNLLLGVEADFQASGQNATTQFNAVIVAPGVANNPVAGTNTTKLDWFGTARGRLGFVSDRWLVYATAGLAYGKINVIGSAQPANPLAVVINAPIVWDQSTTKVGWTIGAGLENAINQNWSFRVEYLYVDFGSVTANVSGGLGGPLFFGLPANCYGGVPGGCHVFRNSATGALAARITDNILRFGINYKF